MLGWAEATPHAKTESREGQGTGLGMSFLDFPFWKLPPRPYTRDGWPYLLLHHCDRRPGQQEGLEGCQTLEAVQHLVAVGNDIRVGFVLGAEEHGPGGEGGVQGYDPRPRPYQALSSGWGPTGREAETCIKSASCKKGPSLQVPRGSLSSPLVSD